jgi:hypothetical protein
VYRILRGAAPRSLKQPIRRAPYIAIGSSIRAATRAHERLKHLQVKPECPGAFPLIELVRAMGISLGDIRTSEQRWAVAHDMGHLMLEHPNAPRWYLDCEADVFARELLIPARVVVPVRRLRSPRELSRMFGVPFHKMEWALSEYSDRGGTFKCSIFPDYLECASISSIAECRRLGTAPADCVQAAMRGRSGLMSENNLLPVALADGCKWETLQAGADWPKCRHP